MMIPRAKKTGRCTSCAASRMHCAGVCVPSCAERWRTMFSIITTEPSTNMPKSSAPSESRLAGMWLRSRQMEANINEKGMVSDTMIAPRTLPRKRKRMMETSNMPRVRLCSTVSTV